MVVIVTMKVLTNGVKISIRNY